MLKHVKLLFKIISKKDHGSINQQLKKQKKKTLQKTTQTKDVLEMEIYIVLNQNKTHKKNRVFLTT